MFFVKHADLAVSTLERNLTWCNAVLTIIISDQSRVEWLSVTPPTLTYSWSRAHQFLLTLGPWVTILKMVQNFIQNLV